MGRLWLEDTGSTTVESALGITAIVSVMLAVVTGLIAVAGYIGAVDTAGAAARAHSLGVDYQPAKGEVSIHEHGGLISAVAHYPAPWGTISATATFPSERYQGPHR